jgi:hypothetical protein
MLKSTSYRTFIIRAVHVFRFLIAALVLAIFLPKLLSVPAKEIWPALFLWSQNPTGFVVVFTVGFIISLKWPVSGNIILLAGALLYFVINPKSHMFSLVFLLPVVMMAVLGLLIAKKRGTPN